MKQWKIILLIMLTTIPIATAICCEKNEECIIAETCQDAACGNCSIIVYNETGTVMIPRAEMTVVNQYLYNHNATTKLENYGTYPYAINCTNNKICQGECRVEIKSECFGTKDEYYLYIVGIVLFFIIIGLGYFLEDSTFVIISGFLLCVIAIALYQFGFPKLDNEFLKHGIIIVLVGIGFYLIIAPSIEYFQEFKGSFGGRLE